MGRRALIAVAVVGLLILVGFALNGVEPGILGFFAAIGIFWFLIGLRSVLKDEKVERGEALMREGRFSQASALLEEEARKFQLNAKAMCALGVCRLNLWQLERSVEALDKARLQQPLSHAGDSELADRAQQHLAMALVLFGRWTDGRDWMLQVAPLRQDRGLGPLTFAAVAAREEKWSEVRARLTACQRDALSKPMQALALVFTAWCAEKLGESRPAIDRVALYAEAGPEELKKRWPELAEFVDRAA